MWCKQDFLSLSGVVFLCGYQMCETADGGRGWCIGVS